MSLAKRLKNLGTETAFKISELTFEWKNKGYKIYPFHIGDLNFPTPEHIVDIAFKAIKDGKTGYSPSPGILALRDAIAEDVTNSRGVKYDYNEVSIQPGGKPVIGKFIQAVINPGDEVLYPSPGYPIYESQIEYFGGIPKPYRFLETNEGFKIDIGNLESLITKKTKAIIYNNCHNPLGVESSDGEMEALSELILKNDLYVLSDEAYFDIRYRGKTRSIVSFSGLKNRTIILYTFSKKYAMTGWRLGAAIGPKRIIDVINKLNVNIESCTNHFVQYAGISAIKGPDKDYKNMIQELEERRNIACDILNSINGVRVYKPDTTFYLFPDVTEAMDKKGIKSLDELVFRVIADTGVAFTTRSHFGRRLPDEKRYYIRIAYSGVTKDEIREGLNRLKEWFEN